jgi:4-alpha-glucanotransferase
MVQRRNGVLAHPTSFPSKYGIGDLGPEAYKFVDFLVRSGQSIWQILPLNPTEVASFNVPYCSYSAFAGNPLLISPELLVKDGLLQPGECEEVDHENIIDYTKVTAAKEDMFEKAFSRFKPDSDYKDFCTKNAYWLDDFAEFKVLRDLHGLKSWIEWDNVCPEPSLVGKEKFVQYKFFSQWAKVKEYANSQGIKVFGDMAIYINFDSPDVWRHPELFRLDPDTKKPKYVSGAPPDYFSPTIQVWWNPLYAWDEHLRTGFRWWMRRIARNLELFDMLRIDHIRGLVAYYEIPADNPTTGRWVKTPYTEFFDTMAKTFDMKRFVAEDLGSIDEEVRQVLKKYNLPGMNLLQMAFGPDMATNSFAPHNQLEHSFVYSGTHDNNTSKGWYQEDLDVEGKNRLQEYLGKRVCEDTISWDMIELALKSPANTAIVTVTDLVSAGSEARLNKPGTSTCKYDWKLVPGQLTESCCVRLKCLTTYHRRC